MKVVIDSLIIYLSEFQCLCNGFSIDSLWFIWL